MYHSDAVFKQVVDTLYNTSLPQYDFVPHGHEPVLSRVAPAGNAAPIQKSLNRGAEPCRPPPEKEKGPTRACKRFSFFIIQQVTIN